MNKESVLTRRGFLKTSLHLAGLYLLNPIYSAASNPIALYPGTNKAEVIYPTDKKLKLSKQAFRFYHVHTRESFGLEYGGWINQYDLGKLNYFLRDFHTGGVHSIDTELLDILYHTRKKAGSRGRIEVISGYRTKQTNDKLRASSRRVAKKSLHIEGRALDFRLSDVRTNKVRDLAIALHKGGVGYYGSNNFIHVDTGDFRIW